MSNKSHGAASHIIPGAPWGSLHTMGKGTKSSSDINPADFCSITSEINLAQAEHFELTCWERIKDGEEILMEI